LYKKNTLPPLPTLFCLKNIGPLSFNFIKMEHRKNKGDKKSSPKEEARMSKDLFIRESAIITVYNKGNQKY
jgi:hypothetical protein